MSDMFESIIHFANAEDEATGDAFEVFLFEKIGKRKGQIKVPRQDLQKADALHTLLVRKNANLPFDPKSGSDKLKKLIESRPKKKFLYSAQMGWRPNRHGFVMPSGTIGCSNYVRCPLPPLWLGDRHLMPLKKVGTLKAWQDTVARYALRSNVAMLAICAAFAAPLLSIAGRPSFGLNFFGAAKAGKTTALLAGTSVIGIGREGDLPNWGATAAARGELARVFRDMLFPLNEVGLLGGSKKKAYPEIREAIYRLAEDRERQRHTESAFAISVATSEVHTIFLSAAEYSFDEYAMFAGEARDDGEYARCIDIQVTGSDRRSIIDRFPRKLNRAKRKRWARDRVIELRNACKLNCGTAFAAYIEYLIASRDRLEKQIDEYVAEFNRLAGDPGVKGALEHACQNMALLYAAARLAIDARVLSWPPEKVLRAIATCRKRALAQHHTQHDPLDQAKRTLRAKLLSDRVRERDRSASFSPKQADGIYLVESSIRRYTIHAAAMRKWLAGDAKQFEALIEWLSAEGLLIPRNTKSGAVGSDWAIQTPKWPNGKSERSVVFRDPFAGSKRR